VAAGRSRLVVLPFHPQLPLLSSLSPPQPQLEEESIFDCVHLPVRAVLGDGVWRLG